MDMLDADSIRHKVITGEINPCEAFKKMQEIHKFRN